MHYYNEHDPNAAAWLEELIAGGDLPPGLVDDRDVQGIGLAEPLDAYDQCHFFAGIGGWPHALDLAGWPRDRAVWTASLPCQPFSDAGKSLGTDDERHLWPTFHRLVERYRPVCIVGEQVASKAGRAWFAAVQIDLAAMGYWAGAIDICAAGIGAPHIRQRLYWCAVRVADGNGAGLEVLREQPPRHELASVERGSTVGGLANDEEGRRGQVGTLTGGGAEGGGAQGSERLEHGSSAGGLVQPDGAGREPGRTATEAARHRGAVESAGNDGRNPWGNVVAVPCADGKSRLLESCAESVADGFPAQLVRGGDPGSPPDQGNEEAETQVTGRTTPRASDPKAGHNYTANMTGKSLSMDASLTGWPTPNTSEGGLTSRSGARKGELLVGGIARSMPDPGPRVAFPPLVTRQTDDLNDTNEARAMRLKGYGNAIVAPLAAEFISAFMEILNEEQPR